MTPTTIKTLLGIAYRCPAAETPRTSRLQRDTPRKDHPASDA